MTDLVTLMQAPTAIVGTTGAGKTYAAKGAVEALLREERRVIIIDPTGAWYGLRAGADGLPDGGFPVTIFGGDNADLEIAPDAGKLIAEALALRHVQAIIDISDMTGGEKVRFLTPFLETLYALNRAPLHLVVDEADEVCPQQPMPDEKRLSGAFDKIVRRGRIKGFRPLMITQRPAVLHKNVLSQIGTLVALKLTSPQDRDAIQRWVEGNADRDKAKEVMQSLPTLARGTGWVWAPAQDVLELREFPAIATYDSSRTPEDGDEIVNPVLSGVDLVALRDAVAATATAQSTTAANPGVTDARALEAEHERGFNLGYASGQTVGRNEGYAMGRSDASRRLLEMVQAFVLENAEAAPPPQAAPVPAPPPVRADPAPGVPDALGRGARTLLDPFISMYPRWLTFEQAAQLAKRSTRSSQFRPDCKAIEDAGVLESNGNRLRLTTAAAAMFGVDGMLGHRGRDTLGRGRETFPPAWRRLLDVLTRDAGAVDMDQWALKAGVSATSSTVGAAAREFVECGLAERDGRMIALSAEYRT